MRKIRRANARWRENAPDYIVDCFHEPKYADCYTVITNKGYEHNGDTYYLVLGTSANLGTSGWQEIKHHDITAYRYRLGHRRIRWTDLPEAVRSAVTQDMEND